MYKRILAPLDGSKVAEAVLPVAERLAVGLGAQILLLYVLEEETISVFTKHMHGRYAKSPVAGLTSFAEAYLRGVAGDLRIPHSQVHTCVKTGNVPAAIVEKAEGVDDTIIAMCTHGRSGVSRFLLGSVATKVLHSTKTPLLLFQPGEADAGVTAAILKTIVVPLDGSELAEQALPHVESLATALRLEVLLARATPTLAEIYVPVGYRPDYSYNPAEFFEDMEREAVGYLSAKTEELKSRGLANVSTKHLLGRAALCILDLVHDTPGCLVAITTHGRSGLGRWVLGSVADRLVNHANAPVLVIRPRVS